MSGISTKKKILKSEDKIKRDLYLFPTILGLIILISFSIVIYNSIESFKDTQFNELEKQLLNKEKESSKLQLDQAASRIEFMTTKTEKSLKIKIKNRVNEASEIIDNIIKENRDKSKDEIKKLVAVALSPIRFFQNRGYYLVYDKDTKKSVIHPVKKFIGKDMSQFRDAKGQILVDLYAETIKGIGEGYANIYFVKPNEKNQKEYKKIVFVKSIPELNWVIGTGEYVDDVKKEIQKEVLDRLESLRYGKNGYLWVHNTNHKLLMNPYRKDVIGIDDTNLEDSNGKKIIQEFVNESKNNKNGAFVEYYWKKPYSGDDFYKKISYVKYIPQWDWVIGTGVYLDDIHQLIKLEQDKYDDRISNLYNTILILLGIILVVILSISFGLLKRINKEFSFYSKELQESNDKLHDSEERFSLAMQGADDGLWDWNLLTDEVYYSPRWKSMLGYKDNELKNHLETWASLVNEEDKEIALKQVDECIKGQKEIFNVEMRMRHKNGNDVIVLSRAFLKKDKNNKPCRLIGTHVDITERTKAEEFISKTNDILKMVALGEPASKIYDAIALMYESRHPGLRCSLLELEDGRLLHGGAPSMPKEYCDAVHGLENGPNVGSCGRSTYTGHRVLVENIETDSKWENLKDYALPHGMRCCWSEPIINSNGEVLGAFGMYYNHTALPNDDESQDLLSASRLASIVMERDQAQKRIKYDQELIAEQSKLAAMGEMIGNIAHQWRQPLSVISTAATGLKLQKECGLLEDNMIDNTCIMINDNAQFLSRTIEDFKNFAKNERKKTSVSIIENINSFLSLVDGSIKNHNINIILNVSDIKINTYPNELIQCYINIFNNAKDALKLIETERYLFISSIIENDKLVIRFKDNATGIDETILPRIFEPYFTTKHKSNGTGLGLHMTYNFIVEGMKGTVEANNVEFAYKDKQYTGVEFMIKIPII